MTDSTFDTEIAPDEPALDDAGDDVQDDDTEVAQ